MAFVFSWFEPALTPKVWTVFTLAHSGVKNLEIYTRMVCNTYIHVRLIFVCIYLWWYVGVYVCMDECNELIILYVYDRACMWSPDPLSALLLWRCAARSLCFTSLVASRQTLESQNF